MELSNLLSKPKNIPLDKELFKEMYRQILRVRLFEEETIKLFHTAKIIGYLHPSLGNEAAEVGASFALKEDDVVFPTHRGHGFFVTRGASFEKLLAELMGREAGYCMGRSGDLHMAAPEVGLMQVQGILGAQLPNAVGSALAHKMQKNSRVTLCAFGDGAAGNGSFHESLNLASILKVPVVFLCVNNGYAASFSFKNSTAVTTNAIRCVSYSMPGYDIDGKDVWEVYSASKEAIDRARSGDGPSIIQVNTFRWRGHDPNDDAPYRPKEELKQWDKNDPVRITSEKVIKEGILDQKDIDGLKEEITAEIDKAVEWAQSQDLPEFDKYLADVQGKY
jgi:acetoin:2,6-dichlorophenolindophenol oxidoreductase subunit alpha